MTDDGTAGHALRVLQERIAFIRAVCALPSELSNLGSIFADLRPLLTLPPNVQAALDLTKGMVKTVSPDALGAHGRERRSRFTVLPPLAHRFIPSAPSTFLGGVGTSPPSLAEPRAPGGAPEGCCLSPRPSQPREGGGEVIPFDRHKGHSD